MSADTLTVTSRNFFERTKAKLWASIIVAGAGLMLLGFTSIAGGISQSSALQADLVDDKLTNDDELKASYAALASGYGSSIR